MAANTLLEQTRALHEDAERLERLIVKDYKQEVKGFKEKLMQSHRVRKRLDQMQECARKLTKVYQDDDEERKEEIAALGSTNTTQLYSNFYERLREVRDFHKRFPSAEMTEAEDDSALLKDEPHVEFTGEESGGRCVDMHQLHFAFTNAPFGSKEIDYLAYLGSFAQFGGIAKGHKLTRGYREYLDQLRSYLQGFYERTQPLASVGRQLSKMAEDLQPAWEAGTLPGWEDKGLGRVLEDGAQAAAVDLDVFESLEELETLGADRLKEALQGLGLKCGGTPRQRAERLWAVRGRKLTELDPKLFAKGMAPAATLHKSEADRAKQEKAGFAAAVLEAQVARLSELLANVISDTRARVEKKQAQTYEELAAEMEEAEAEAAVDDDEEEEEYVYNPLKLPLGWDGKPIPYWLYKLHGLNQEFKCEICGNYSYWGRRAFERHFKEWRHANGMKALGIPNNKDFFEVTKIEDAQALWRTLQSRQTGGFNPETDEELEDAQGNVYNRKTYEDLRRQGLL